MNHFFIIATSKLKTQNHEKNHHSIRHYANKHKRLFRTTIQSKSNRIPNKTQ